MENMQISENDWLERLKGTEFTFVIESIVNTMIREGMIKDGNEFVDIVESTMLAHKLKDGR